MKKHIFPLSLIVLSLVFWYVVWDKLPSSLPTHWGVNGEVDNTSSVAGTFFLINGLLIGVYLLMIILPKIDPRKKNYSSFKKSYYLMQYSIVSLFFLISIGTLAIGLGADFDMTILITGFLGIFFIILGLLMSKFEQNYFVGIRTPWTISNEVVWEKTHKLGGKLYIASGVLTMFAMLFLPEYALIVTVSSIISAGIISVVYSYIIFTKLGPKE